MDPLNSHTINLYRINNNLWSYATCYMYMYECVQSLREPDIYDGLSIVLNQKNVKSF